MDKNMKIIVLSLILSLWLLGCSSHYSKKPGWAETVGTISESAQMPDGSYAYTIMFYADKSTAVNDQNEPIKGPIELHYFLQKKLAVQGQTFKMRYDIEEPIFNEILEDIKFVE
jgi:hypothetical protein